MVEKRGSGLYVNSLITDVLKRVMRVMIGVYYCSSLHNWIKADGIGALARPRPQVSSFPHVSDGSSQSLPADITWNNHDGWDGSTGINPPALAGQDRDKCLLFLLLLLLCRFPFLCPSSSLSFVFIWSFYVNQHRRFQCCCFFTIITCHPARDLNKISAKSYRRL